MSLEKLFTRYGSPSNEAEVCIRDHLIKPSKLDTAQRIADYDKSAADTIQCCKELIEDLSIYRQDLARRYAELETMPYKLRLELERQKRYDNKVRYYIRLIKAYEDGSEIKELDETYAGTERGEALKRFEELKKARPGIEAVKNIAKGQWEK
jgi:hypothetical protein